MKQPCWIDGCNHAANYWYIALGQRVGMCFGHATAATRTPGEYGRRVRKERP